MTLGVVDQFTYLSSTITSNLSLDADINMHIAKAATVMSKLNKRVWSNTNVIENINYVFTRHVPSAPSSLAVTGDAWTTYTTQEKRLNSFHLRCLRRILAYSGRICSQPEETE